MKFGIVRFIIAIILLIVIIQVLTTIYFSSTHWPDEHVEIGNHHVGRLHKIRAHVDATQVPGHNNNRSPREEESEKDSKPAVLEVPFVPPCEVKHKDAVSALRRVKSEACKRLIYKTACLSEAKKLYNLNIKRTCPVPREKGSPAKWIDVANTPYGNPIRVAFVITLHGRAFRQVKRLFKAIYHTNHYFFFHIDSRSDYLRREVLKMIRNFPNAAVAPWSMATIWGGASLLKMLLKCMEDLMSKKEWKWDFFINLSESDYPIKHNSALVEFLRARRDFNFLKPHGRELARFIKKQGLDRTFLECDEHMWRLGNRSLPPEIDIDGGSDWIALNRKFCHYLYKHIVDWCGCSPNDFKPEDMPRLKTQNQNYFARKFEAIVNQEVINQLDSWLYGSYPADMKGINYYWENIFHHEDSITKTSDVFRTFFQSFVRIGIKNAKMKSTRGNKDHSCLTGGNGKIREVTVLNQHDQFSGVLALFDVELPSGNGATRVVTMETWMAPLSHEELLNLNMSRGPQRLVGLEVGTIWDQKERVFRNLAHLMGPWDDPVLVHHWVHGKEFDVKIMWVDPINVVTGVYEMKVIDNWVVSFHKPTFKKPMRPGKWTVKMVYTRKGEDMVIGQISFLVISMTFSKGKAISSQDAMAANSGPPGGIYNSNDFIIEFDREANNTEALAKKAAENSRKSGSDLDDWVDSEVDYFWTVESLCSPNGQIPGCTDIPLCESTSWSSRSPDPKSELGRVNAHGRLR
ncbi:Xylosyltransferase 2 [Acropora cervicornis]|uniref:protein xylosyltransferase n=1 Tax=Acropora cervicornis TaxID=6130 RepID=A0AAD9QX69_ACRCE|nr:Xylosyltransferase 2 [Acropora cervicornis]